MTFAELQKQALQLSIGERWQLISSLIFSLKPALPPMAKPQGLAASLVGIAKTDAPAPSDAEVEFMLDERRVQKSL